MSTGLTRTIEPHRGGDPALARTDSGTEMIIRIVVDAFNTTPGDMRSNRRDPPLRVVRHVAMWLIRQMTPRSYPTIGRAFGGLDHSSGIYGVS